MELQRLILSDSLAPRSGERVRVRGGGTLTNGQSPHPTRFARRPLPATRGEVNLADPRKSVILPSIQPVRRSSARAASTAPACPGIMVPSSEPSTDMGASWADRPGYGLPDNRPPVGLGPFRHTPILPRTPASNRDRSARVAGEQVREPWSIDRVRS